MADVFQELIATPIAYGIVAVVGGLVSLFLWQVVLNRRCRLLPIQRHRSGAWHGREVFLVFLLLLLVPDIVQGFLEGIGFFQEFYGKATVEKKQLWTMLLAFSLLLAGIFLLLFNLSGTRPRHLGLSKSRLPQNIILGYLTWLPLTILVLGLFFLVLLWTKAKEHSIGLALDNQALVVEWLLGLFTVLIAAPILEELVFRGILLGWLRRCSLVGHLAIAATTLFFSTIPILNYLSQTEEKPVELNVGPLIFALILVACYLWLVHLVWKSWCAAPKKDVSQGLVLEGGPAEQPTEGIRQGRPPIPISESTSHFATSLIRTIEIPKENNQATKRFERTCALAAIFGSSMLWAIFHSPVWPTPIPLFVLGLGLGWLAYRTQNLVSSITVHVLFNAVACLVLAISVFYGEPKGKAQTDAFRPSAAGSNSTMVPGVWWPRFK